MKRKHVALSHLDVIEVTWVDATSLPGWVDRNEAEEVDPQEMRTVGYVLDASPQGITLTVVGNNRIHVQGCDKQQVGQMAA